jgi:predicted dehydrogenase
VASRNAGRARRLLDACQAEAPLRAAPVACGRYAELLTRPDLDADYVGLPTGVRQERVLKTAAAGRHVLCEKPCAVTSRDLRATLDACRQHRIHFTDGVMFLHSRRKPLLRRVLGDPQAVGDVRRIASQFSLQARAFFLVRGVKKNAAGC